MERTPSHVTGDPCAASLPEYGKRIGLVTAVNELQRINMKTSDVSFQQAGLFISRV
jgi:hypothetical protein